MQQKEGIIKVIDLVKDYKLGKTDVHALKKMNLTIYEGDFCALSGISGSGKSTLLNIIGCIDTFTSGDVLVNGASIKKMKDKELNRLRLHTFGFIFQTFNLLPVLTVEENVALPLSLIKDITKEEKNKRVAHFTKEVGLEEFRKHKPYELSGGQRQRVAIARALVTNPKIILADEPTANLDKNTGIEIINLMAEINKKEHTTFIFSTHDQKIVDRASRVCYLEDGVIAKEEVR